MVTREHLAQDHRHDLAFEIYHIKEPQKVPTILNQDETKRLLVDADHGDLGACWLGHGRAPCDAAPVQRQPLAGQEHGRTIPLGEVRARALPVKADVQLLELPGGRITCGRGRAAQGQAYRQRADDHPRRAVEGAQGSAIAKAQQQTVPERAGHRHRPVERAQEGQETRQGRAAGEVTPVSCPVQPWRSRTSSATTVPLGAWPTQDM